MGFPFAAGDPAAPPLSHRPDSTRVSARVSAPARSNDSAAKQLDEVVVTATKYPVKQSQTGKVVIVIPHEEIEKSIGKPLGELLSEQAGITVNGSLNDAGTNQSVYIRGAGSGRTLVLIDGCRSMILHRPTTASTSTWSPLP